MKLSAMILSVTFATVALVRADVTITWNSYSTAGFDVLINGTGSFTGASGVYGGWIGTTTSPDGLWSLQTQNAFRLYTPFPGTVEIFNAGFMTNSGTLLGYVNPAERT